MTSRRSNGFSGRRAFTLTELCLVVAVCGLAASLAWPALKDFTRTLAIQAAADALADQLSAAREAAVVSGAPQSAQPRPGGTLMATKGSAVFHPDGSATAFQARFGTAGRARLAVTVRQTGEIHVEAL
jgi:Tfp pilus assembly protein FimT